MRREWIRLATLCLVLVVSLLPGILQAQAYADCDRSVLIGGNLPLPCTLPLADYEQVLYTWINEREYTRLGWQRDKHVRDTGPFILGTNYGTHPAVRIYYSPEVYDWLKGGRQGDLPVGSMIVKEMFNPPAARFEELRPDGCTEGNEPACQSFDQMLQESLSNWTVMIKDDQTKDGWFWAGPAPVERRGRTPEEFEEAIADTVTTNDFPFNFRDSDHGQASCLRCHSSSESEFTFSSLKNIEGDELHFRVDNSWRTGFTGEQSDRNLPPEQRPGAGENESALLQNAFHGNSSAATTTPDGKNLVRDPLPTPNPEFLKYFTLEGKMPSSASQVQHFPGQWADHVSAGPDGAEQFITSDNCIGCHGGLGGPPYGLTMFIQTGPNYGDGYNVSPYGEWRWSPMGLAGRDPAFFSQLASELAILDGEFKGKTLKQAKNAVVNTCLSCHGAMGQRQLLIDALGDPDLDPNFKTEYVYAHTPLTESERTPLNDEFHKYGNLAREGISCTLCHHIDPPKGWKEGMSEEEKLVIFLMTSTTGQFPYSPPDELSGPFDDVQTKPMEHALGITPKENAYIRDSKMCGTCHTINLPNVDSENFQFPALDKSARIQADRLKRDYGVDYAEFLTQFPHSIEQATFLEWQNSSFGDPEDEAFQSCQDCHMPNSFHSLDGSVNIDPLASQIASIQDSTYPEAEHTLPPEDLFVPVRPEYRRHELVGLNVFLLEIFDQFDPILGIAETDYMTSASTGNRLAMENMLRQAENETVQLDVAVQSVEGDQLTADVTVTNLVGHRFPSGVGFRRTWIEFLLLDEERGGEVVWASGRTNSVGLIVDEENEPLVTEFFQDNQYQPHYHGIPDADGPHPAITQQNQVQIYEEVILNGEGNVGFSFIHRDTHAKDNRLLPKGWKASDEFENEVLEQFMESTDPKGVKGDPDYVSVPGFKGQDTVRYIVPLEGRNPEKLSVQVTMHYQAFQPYWLQSRFQLSGHTPATQRLYFMASHLATENTIIDDWKLPLVTVSAPLVTEAPNMSPGDLSP